MHVTSREGVPVVISSKTPPTQCISASLHWPSHPSCKPHLLLIPQNSGCRMESGLGGGVGKGRCEVTSENTVQGEIGVMEKESSGFEMHLEDKTVRVLSRLDIGSGRTQLCWEWPAFLGDINVSLD